ncbi:hypothetical protein LX32DRAFT_647186 [Colletotrichum zoysiae]|uniref:Uncharacterized protein n=1 Tax=Colletotrichum zoysiae TaxID=1216348 RepID=A0AAD9LT05_9PEZI|nr:hypothetical protein LX32DRAFT_647186 [Colletotrichum zoysiae]
MPQRRCWAAESLETQRAPGGGGVGVGCHVRRSSALCLLSGTLRTEDAAGISRDDRASAGVVHVGNAVLLGGRVDLGGVSSVSDGIKPVSLSSCLWRTQTDGWMDG